MNPNKEFLNLESGYGNVNQPLDQFPINPLLVLLMCSLPRLIYRAEALAAVQGAIRLAQEANDHVCLQHALVSLV